jgi:hypothetical protein
MVSSIEVSLGYDHASWASATTGRRSGVRYDGGCEVAQVALHRGARCRVVARRGVRAAGDVGEELERVGASGTIDGDRERDERVDRRQALRVDRLRLVADGGVGLVDGLLPLVAVGRVEAMHKRYEILAHGARS